MNNEMTGRSDEGSINRRNPRVPVNFDVEIEGQTRRGVLFRVAAKAELVSSFGATLIADVIVESGAAVRLTTPFGAVFEAEVNGIWVNEADGQQRVGVKLIRPQTWISE